MDERLRDLERKWRAGEQGAFAQFLQAHERAGIPLPWEAISALPRWRGLVDFAARWGSRPLGPGDGLPDEAISRKEAELGRRLPAALREWYRLVGASLHAPYDLPTLLEELTSRSDDDGVAYLGIFEECHGHYQWAVLERDLKLEDPPVVGSHQLEPFGHFAEHLSEFLTAKAIEGAIWGIEERHGVVGQLSTRVQGAWFRLTTNQLLEQYEVLSLTPLLGGNWKNDSRWLGDQETILLLSASDQLGGAIASTKAAWERFLATPGVTVRN